MSIRDVSDSDSRDKKLDQAIMEFLRTNEDGKPLDIQGLLEKHASVADELEAFINQQIKFGKLTTPVRAFSALGEFESEPTIQEFGDYEVIREIGRGGMGVIYEARQKGLSRRVALKMIRDSRFRTQEDLARFQSEAEAAAALEHPNIVPVYRVGAFDGHPFFTMKLVRGGSLKEALQNGPLSSAESARVALAIARGVSFAHQRLILHRDLKPANILLDSKSQSSSSNGDSASTSGAIAEALSDSDSSDGLPVPMISDFGLAKQLNAEFDQGLTMTGAILGTPSFMAPEQALGQPTTTSTDIYAVGAILYNMLTGDPPFSGNSPAEVTRKVIDQTPKRIGWKAKVDLDLETICMKCLEKEPARRYGSASELAEDLENWGAGKPIRARRSNAFEQLAKWARRHPRFATLLCSSVILLGLTLAGAIMFSFWLNTEVAKSDEALSRLKSQEKETVEQRDLAERGLFEAKFAEVAALRTSGDMGQQFGALEAAKEAVALFPKVDVSRKELFELRSETAGCLANADIIEIASWRVPDHAPTRMNTFNHDLSLFVNHPKVGAPIDIHETKELIRTASVDKSTPIVSFDIGNGIISGYACQFSSCGQYMGVNTIRAENNKEILTQYVFDIVKRQVIFQEDDSFFACFGERDSEKLLATSDAKHITIFRLPTLEKVTTLINPSPISNCQMYFSPDGKWLARTGGQGAFVINIESGELVWQKHAPSYFGGHLEWNPNRKEFAMRNQTSIQIWNFETTPRLVKTYPQHPSTVFRVNSAAGGSVLAASTYGDTTHFWDTQSGEQICTFPGAIDRFKSDGRTFGFCGDISGICEFDSGRLRRTISTADTPTEASQPLDLDVHPNDRWVAMGDFKDVRICDLKSGQRLIDLPGKGRVRFHPDGKSLFIGNHTLRRWSIKEEGLPDGKLKLTIGPPEKIASINPRHGNVEGLDVDPTGKYLAYLSRWNGAFLVDLTDSSAKPVRMGPLPSTRGGICVSNNGRIVAVGNHHRQGCHVFEGKTGKRLFVAPTPSHGRCSISPDGNLLVVTYNSTADVYDTRTQQKIYSIDEPDFEVAWPSSISKDGKLVLFTLRNPRGTLIVDAASGERLIRIPGAAGTAPRDARSLLTKDYQLVTVKKFNSLESWDLATIRDRLSELGLDWESDQPSVSKSNNGPPEIPSVEVLWATSRSDAYKDSLLGANHVFSWEVAETVFEDWLARNPKDPDLWQAKAAAKSKLGDRSALQDIAHAIELSGNDVDPEIYFLRTITERELNACENVISDLTAFLDLNENGEEASRMDAVNLLAWEMALEGKLQHGGRDALELARKHLTWVGQQEMRQGDFQSWLQDSFQSPDSKPKSRRRIIAMKTLSLALLRSGKSKFAQPLLQSIAPSTTNRFSEANSGVEFLLAMCEAENGNRDKALQHFENELSSEHWPGFSSVSAAAATDWWKLRSLAQQRLALESKQDEPTTLQWSPMELATRSRWDRGSLAVQFIQKSKQFVDVASGPEFELTEKPVSNLYWNTTNRSEGELTFELDVTAGGVFDGRIYLGHSFDYGLFEFELNGKPVGRRFDGQSDQVVFGDFVDFADVELRKGTNRLTVRNVGKSRDSTGFYLGVESLEFTPK